MANQKPATDWETVEQMVASLPSYVYFADEQDTKESLLFGGVLVHRKKLAVLDRAMAEVKEEFGLSERDPVKWSPPERDAYAPQRDLAPDKRVALRGKVLALLDDLEATCFFALAWKGSRTRTAPTYMEAFRWVLQRLIITIEREATAKSAVWYPALDVVVDWFPEADKCREFFAVYHSAFHNGYTFPGKNDLPPLKEYGACPCLLVTSCQFSPALQLADFTVGAMGRFLRWAYKRDGDGKNIAALVEPVVRHLLRVHGTVIGYGLVPPTTGTCRDRIRAAFKDLGLS